MKTIAVILTVYNRREVTLNGLRSLYRAIEALGVGYAFDIYMTDDGCTDGTAEAIAEEFPQIIIIKGDGNLYWSGGMRKAWQSAIDSGFEYNYYLWFNDDAELYDDALKTMFSSMEKAGGNVIISGAFCDHEGKVSYGGRDKKNCLIIPNGQLQNVFFMNGNLTLIPNSIVIILGNISLLYTHSLGDWDYGCRAIKSGYKVLLTGAFVGITDRHDKALEAFRNPRNPIMKRICLLYSPRFAILTAFQFDLKYQGIFKAVKNIVVAHIYAVFPYFFKLLHK